MNRLADVSSSHDNNLNLIRFIAAALVIISHSFPISYGAASSDIIGTYTNNHLDLGGFAVGVFFVSGGFLIAGSAERKRNTLSFFFARIKRIFPPLIFTITLSIFIGSILTSLSATQYFTNFNTWKYLLNILLIPIHSLPGVFENNPYPLVVNGPLWTLPIEFCCYIACCSFYKLGFFEQKKYIWTIPFITIVTLLFVIFMGNNIFALRIFRPVILYYIGIGYYIFRDKIVLNNRYGIIAALLFILSILLKLTIIGMLIFFPYMIIWMAYGIDGKAHEFGKKHEISYGMYLWGWPFQQILAYINPFFQLWYVNAIFAIILAIIFGTINNILIEQKIK